VNLPTSLSKCQRGLRDLGRCQQVSTLRYKDSGSEDSLLVVVLVEHAYMQFIDTAPHDTRRGADIRDSLTRINLLIHIQLLEVQGVQRGIRGPGVQQRAKRHLGAVVLAIMQRGTLGEEGARRHPEPAEVFLVGPLVRIGASHYPPGALPESLLDEVRTETAPAFFAGEVCRRHHGHGLRFGVHVQRCFPEYPVYSKISSEFFEFTE
jgi:hypothetical protein